ncbi:tubulin delta chain-like isoform X2 [Hemiscyllium ocellatum]|uniref:tubulin delta chain-like isoform X2 n=1 Tax=Hemiscyllium ocellatum TaxID=170820 RepID=UPI0029670A0E|nr:tubulin delta chain-like isoform X2 [Hemiscyllium ocellatum]
MSTIWLQIGQCGNQVGQEWWKLVTNEKAPNSTLDRYPFRAPDGKLSALCVDSEPKVVRSLLREVKSGSFRDSNISLGLRGRGNNWALGYHGLKREDDNSLLHRTLDSFRKEVERRDAYSGVVLLHSLTGGTGSGLGAHLCESIREEFPVGYILSVTVAPHQVGESPLQHYNSLLCLSWLQRYADGVLLFHNDDVLRRMQVLCGKKIDHAPALQPPISLSDMNTHIASCLAGLMYPVSNLRTQRGTASWDSMLSSIVRTLPRHSPTGDVYQSTAVLAVARGNRAETFNCSLQPIMMKMKQGYGCVSWNSHPLDSWTDPCNIVDLMSSSHSLTICANHSSVSDYIQRVLEKAQTMYDAHAYLHWYWKHGCEEEDFMQAFEILDSVVKEYIAAGDH